MPGKSHGVNAFALELEDYLVGLTYLPNELVRHLNINLIIVPVYNIACLVSSRNQQCHCGGVHFAGTNLTVYFRSVRWLQTAQSQERFSAQENGLDQVRRQEGRRSRVRCCVARSQQEHRLEVIEQRAHWQHSAMNAAVM